MEAEKRGKGPTPWQRVLLTVLLALAPVAGQFVPMPAAGDDTPLPRATASVFALGITPLLSSYALIEIAALLVPRWRRLRHHFPDGRARLRRSTIILAFVFASFQGFGASMMLDTLRSQSFGSTSFLNMVALVAAFGVLLLILRAIDGLGLVSGVLALSLTSEALRVPEMFERAPRLEPRNIALVVLLYALPALATWAALRRAEQGAERGPAWLGGPLSSLRPVVLTASLLALPRSLDFAKWESVVAIADWIGGPHYFDILLGLSLLSTLLLGYLLQMPKRVLRVLRGLDPRRPVATEQDVWQSLRAGAVPTLLLILTLLFSGQVLQANGLPDYAYHSALLTVLVLDGVQAFQLHRARPNLTCVWQERRPYAVPGLVATAEQAGMTLQATGLGQTSALRLFGPFAAISLWCAAEQAEEARRVLGEALLRANGTVAPPSSAPEDDDETAEEDDDEEPHGKA